MEQTISILQLTSLTAVVTAAVFLTWLAKYYLADVPVLSRFPTWLYTCAFAGILALIANRVTGTLPGQTGVLIIDAIINGALASGLRAIVTNIAAALGDSGTANQKRRDDAASSIGRRSLAWLLPLVLAGSMVALPACTGGGLKPPVITPEDQTQVRAVVTKALAGIEVAGVIVRDGRQLVSDLATARIVSIEIRSAVNAAVIQANDVVQRVITELAGATRLVTVEQLTQQAYDALVSLAELLERQADARIQTAGRFLRTAAGALPALIGGAR